METKIKTKSGFKKLVTRNEFILLIVLAALWVILRCFNDGFTSAANILTIIKSLSFYGIVAAGMAWVIICGDIDISVGAVASFGSVFSTWFMLKTGCFGLMNTQNEWLGALLCVLITVLIAVVIGFLNGVMMVKLKLPAFIATVAMKYTLSGVVVIITNGTPVYPLPASFDAFGKSGIPIAGAKLSYFFIIMLALIVISELILRFTTFGRGIYATGSNIQAAKLSGINTDRNRFIALMLVSSLAAFSGSMNAAYIGQGSVQVGLDWEMMVIATCVIGGIKMSGGSGNLIGVFIGLFIINTLNSAIAMLGINTFLQEVILGLMLMFIVAIDAYREKRKIKA